MPRRENEFSQFRVQGHPSSVVNGCGVINGSVTKFVFHFTGIGWRQTIPEKARAEEIGQTVRYTIHELEARCCELRRILQLQLSDYYSFIDSSELVREDIKIRQNF